MTIQRKQTVALNDVAALVIQCKHCATAVSFPPGAAVNYKRMAECPNCGDEWIGSTDPLTLGGKFADFVKALVEFNAYLEARADKPKGFIFALELRASDPE